jgi:hypothetical protein
VELREISMYCYWNFSPKWNCSTTTTLIVNMANSLLPPSVKFPDPHIKKPTDGSAGAEISDDILFGAYLMAHLRLCCENCGTQDTPQW